MFSIDLQASLSQIWEMIVLLSLPLLLGFLLAGLIYILIPATLIQKWIGKDGFGSVFKASLFGIPLPLCSCSVIPVAVSLGQKKATKPAILSFLITTPETGVDSIFVTWVLLGPWVTLARVIASLFAGLLGGLAALGLLSKQETVLNKETKSCCPKQGEDEDYVGLKNLYLALKTVFIKSHTEAQHSLTKIAKNVFHYSYVRLADDILPSLLLGLMLAAVILIVMPDNLEQYGLGEGLLPYLIMFAVSLPLYMCATASTPIAAVFIMKGIDPGAVLVFLLAGPATNASTIVVLTKQFGLKFVQIYLASIICVSWIAGVLFSYAVEYFDIASVVKMGDGLVHEHSFAWLSYLSVSLMCLLFIWRGTALLMKKFNQEHTESS